MTEHMITFTVPGLAPASWSGNSRSHWRTRHKDGAEYAERVWLAPHNVSTGIDGRQWRDFHDAPSDPSVAWPWPKAKVTLTQRAVRPRDHDNLLASFKPGLDTLTTKGKRPLGIIEDDSPDHLTIEVRTEHVKKKADECIIVEIERLA